MHKKQDSKNRKKVALLEGSMTVEAALLLPLLLAVMIFLILLSIFLYNRCAAQALADTAAVMAAGMEHESKATVQKALDGYLSEGKKKLYMVSDANSEASVSLLQVKVRLGISQKVGAVFLPLSNRRAEFSAKATVQRLDPAKYIRTVKIAKKAAGLHRTDTTRGKEGKVE